MNAPFVYSYYFTLIRSFSQPITQNLFFTRFLDTFRHPTFPKTTVKKAVKK